MQTDFSRVLTNLRKEKRISQRQAAESLEISQALLSHYEKGMREPGLAFVCRAADYYNVSCDYLLGRSMSKEGSVLSAEQIVDSGEEKNNTLTGSVVAMLQKKLIINSISVLMDIVSKTKNKELINEVASYFYFPIYKVYRSLVMKTENQNLFSTPNEYYDYLCDAEMKIREAKIKAICLKDPRYSVEFVETDFEQTTPKSLEKEFPKYASSVFSVVQSVTDTISMTTNPHTKVKPKKNKKR